MRILLKYWWLWIILISFTAYAPVFDNFFAWDDFLWLYRAKTMWTDPARIFESEGLYFDPLVYLSFWINYILFGLDPKWYHVTDVTIHLRLLLAHLMPFYGLHQGLIYFLHSFLLFLLYHSSNISETKNQLYISLLCVHIY